MDKYVCELCGYVYDPAVGDPDNGIAPGTEFDELPEDFKKNVEEDGKERVAADWIACMSDRYAISDYEKKFVPKEWM